MEKENNEVMGVHATAPQPNWRGFLILALVLSGPVALIAFGTEFLFRWGF